MQRPTEVTVIACLHWFYGLMLLAFGAGFAILGAALFGAFVPRDYTSWFGGGLLAGALFVTFGVFALVSGVLGWGVWKLRNWARIGVIVISAISILASIAFFQFWDVIFVAIRGWMIYYLLSPQGKAAFNGASVSH